MVAAQSACKLHACKTTGAHHVAVDVFGVPARRHRRHAVRISAHLPHLPHDGPWLIACINLVCKQHGVGSHVGILSSIVCMHATSCACSMVQAAKWKSLRPSIARLQPCSRAHDAGSDVDVHSGTTAC